MSLPTPQTDLVTLRQSQSTVTMTIGDGLTQGTQPTTISSPVGTLILNFASSTNTGGYVYVGAAAKVQFTGSANVDTVIDFNGNTPLLLNFPSNSFGNMTLTNYTWGGTWSSDVEFAYSLAISLCGSLTGIDLTGGRTGVSNTGDLDISYCNGLTSLTVGGVNGAVNLQYLSSLSTLVFTAEFGTLNSSGNGDVPAVRNVSFIGGSMVGNSFVLHDCYLSQASVENILTMCDNTGSYNGTLDVSGGTGLGNSSPPIYDTGGTIASFVLSSSVASYFTPGWSPASIVYFTMWDGKTFWINYDTTGDGSANTANPGFSNEVEITISNGTSIGTVMSTITSVLLSNGYNAVLDSYSNITITETGVGSQPSPSYNDVTGNIYISTNTSGADNNASIKVLSLLSKGWTVTTN